MRTSMSRLLACLYDVRREQSITLCKSCVTFPRNVNIMFYGEKNEMCNSDSILFVSRFGCRGHQHIVSGKYLQHNYVWFVMKFVTHSTSGAERRHVPVTDNVSVNALTTSPYLHVYVLCSNLQQLINTIFFKIPSIYLCDKKP